VCALDETDSTSQDTHAHGWSFTVIVALSLIGALAAAVQFARGFIGLKHPVFVVASALSAVLLTIWVLHLVRAEIRAPAPRDAKGASDEPVQASGMTNSQGNQRGTKVLLQLTIGLAAFLVSQLADRNGGAGHPLAAILIVVGISATGILSELIIRNRWRRTTLATLDSSMATQIATYPRGAARIARVSYAHGASASAATTVAGALVVALALNAFSDRSGRLTSLGGTWEIGQLVTLRDVNLADPATGLGTETWTLAARAGCNEFRCAYNVKAADGSRFALTATGKYTWDGIRIGDAECLNAEAPYGLVVADGYKATENMTFSVDPGNSRTASVEDDAKYAVNKAGKSHGCSPQGSATYAGGTALARARGGSAVTTLGASTSAGTAPPGGSATAQQQQQQASRSVHAHQLLLRRRAADSALHEFVEVRFNQPVRCASPLGLPPGGTAQLSCSDNGIAFVVTRLKSASATDAFLRLRYRQAYPFSGSAGECSASGTSIGTWSDGSGRVRGPWGVRQNHGSIEVLWGYDDSSVAFVATGPLGSALRVCNVWYSHSG
jgi:hypothetical protein